MESRHIARGLGWFSIALGAIELFSPENIQDLTGLETEKSLIQFCGIREILSGVVLLNAEAPEEWLWLRVAGDLMDGALLSTGLHRGNKNWCRTLLASLAAAPVVALDIALAARCPPPHQSHR